MDKRVSDALLALGARPTYARLAGPVGAAARRWPFVGALLSSLGALLAGAYIWVLRSTFKWMWHVWSNRCEIERVMRRRDWPAVGCRNEAFGRALALSKCPELREIPSLGADRLDESMRTIVKLKSIGARDLALVQRPLRQALEQMCGYNTLVQRVETARLQKYDVLNKEHEAKLIKHWVAQLWTLAMGDEVLPARITKRWQALGFQGDDPATDFRGMGVLGLDQLLHLFGAQPELAGRIRLLCAHPTSGFPLAIAGVSMTALLRDLLRTGLLRPHFYNTVDGPPQLHTHYHHAYCQLFSLFCVVWKNGQVESVMEFERVRGRLKRDLQVYLGQPEATLPTAML